MQSWLRNWIVDLGWIGKKIKMQRSVRRKKMRRQSLAGNCTNADVPRLRNHTGNLTRRPERDAQVEVSRGLG